MIELSDSQVIELIEGIVAEKGEDFVYEKPVGSDRCQYVHHGVAECQGHPGLGFETEYCDGSCEPKKSVPGCIVAHFFVRAGVPIEKLFPHEGESALALTSHLWGRELLKISRTAALFLVTVQDHQDQETPWGESVRRARGEFEI